MDSNVEENTCTAVVPIKYSAASILRRPQLWPAHAALLGIEVETREPSSDDASDDYEDSDGDEEVNPLLLDPTQWKDQDHYAILGLGKKRYKASPQQIRKAYRQKVLTHHPDKQTEDQKKDGDDYFKCIQIAYDLLYDTKRRRSYDSIDPTFDDAIPSQSAVSRENFFSMFGTIFLENARWSFNQPVPQLGTDEASLEEVEAFYDFWYNFESWREFSYLDEEKTDKAECREERKWMEKQNKAMRQKRKKEEVARIRSLVDNAYSCDPRVKRFKDAEKAKKIARKKAKEDAVRLEALENRKAEKQRLEEERIEREKKEAELKAQAAQAKKEKEVIKKAIKKERKTFRSAIKGHNYFASNETEVVSRMQDVDRLCEQLPVERLQQINERLSQSSSEEAQRLFEKEVRDLIRRQEEEKEAAAASRAKSSATASSAASASSSHWTTEEVQLLVKAVVVYPVGTVKRWDTIATYVNTHSPDSCKDKTAKNVISKVKGMQKMEAMDKEQQNKMAFSTFEKAKGKAGAVAEAAPTERFDTPTPWTTDEQKLLEQGLRTFPASVTDRWDKIATTVGSRTKAECIARFKEIVAKIKAKKSQTAS